MDIGESDLSPELIATEGEQRSSTNINDVLQAIEAADPDTFRERAVDGGGAMFGGGVLPGVAPAGNGHQTVPYARIKEQPASKALRFRYECEGRSAGSIPGASSTPEHKTFPTVQVVGYRGRAVVVVSCVTIDKPHKPHPHNLVGKDLCKDGVCTTQLNPDTMEASFSNLGIQCVKKRDIEEALRVREKIRVDPFKTGFAHKTQAQGIDLNAVRLCFQVFLEQDGKFNRPLAPVVSDIIYDKKAMSDLLICRMSHCSASVAGGQEVFLLCEKVAKDDISVVMFETGADGRAVWTAAAEAVAVHKQVAIVFRTPRYHNIHVESAVQGFVQLKRPSDGAVSEARPFELKPMTGILTSRRKRDLNSALAAHKLDPNNNQHASPESSDLASGGDTISDHTPDATGTPGTAGTPDTPDRERGRSLEELLDQVAELDEIYSENRTRLETAPDGPDLDSTEDFDDAGTYTSLQLAFKNPVEIEDPVPEDVPIIRGPLVEFAPLRDSAGPAPPLPPKRVRRAPSVETLRVDKQSAESLLKPGRPVPLARAPADLSVSEPALPRPPVKKRSFLSRLFRRRNKSPTESAASGDGVATNAKRSRPVGRSVSSVSAQRPARYRAAVSQASLKDGSQAGLSYADSVTHISLHGDAGEAGSEAPRRSASALSLGAAPPLAEGTVLVAETVLALSASDFRKLQDDLDLTDAEHYALYMAVAPRATHSEFDDTSYYYSPVDANNFQHNS